MFRVRFTMSNGLVFVTRKAMSWDFAQAVGGKYLGRVWDIGVTIADYRVEVCPDGECS